MKQNSKLKFYIFSIFIFISINLFAQKGYNDIVYLKNGSIIHGLVMEVKSDQSVKIQTRDKNKFVYKMEEVDRIDFGVAKNKSEKYSLTSNNSSPYSGICIGIEASVGGGIGNSKKYVNGVFAAHFFCGYKYKSYDNYSYSNNHLQTKLLEALCLEAGISF